MPIPEIDIHYKVRYRVSGYEQEFETEAYSTYEVASEHRQDIAGYEGVHNVYLVPIHPQLEESETMRETND
jgi:hypothetical protein